jgi:predicted nucleic-acid-binding Zn-ribbon protein
VIDRLDACWSCGTSIEGVENPDFVKVVDIPDEQLSAAVAETPATILLTCSRCHCELVCMGPKAFHEGRRWGALGNLSELRVNRERFDVYYCPTCGRVEFYVDPTSEQFRAG